MGITNHDFVVEDGGRKFVVRIGEDIPVHHVMRFNEHSASRAAHAAELSPAVVHGERGVLVLDFVEAETLTEERVREPDTLERLLPVLRRCHSDVARHLRGPV